MITKIEMDGVASYKKRATLETDKKVNIVYGLNGTGKSTISNFLYSSSSPDFSSCKTEGVTDEKILVYNQSFIRDYFYETDDINGIFTLSKENKDAEEKIESAKKQIIKLEEKKVKKDKEINEHQKLLRQKKETAINKTWDIKKEYTGGDRVLEFCLDGLKGTKGKLFDHINSLTKPATQPLKIITELKNEVDLIQGDSAQKYNTLPILSFNETSFTSNPLLEKEIVGNKNSTVSELIEELQNSDWVKKGIGYLPEKIDSKGELCPFCQERTITEETVAKIKEFFDESYEKDLIGLGALLTLYEDAVNLLPKKETYHIHPLVIPKKSEFDALYNAVYSALKKNIKRISAKSQSPSEPISLTSVLSEIESFNQLVKKVNGEVLVHNEKIENKNETLKKINDEFWEIMRWDYDIVISTYTTDSQTVIDKISETEKEAKELANSISSQEKIIQIQQKSTINIEEAISHINTGLTELGIDSFSIKKHTDTLYKIVREEHTEKTFHTLSEGEKTIISFLYFCELCWGKKDATDVGSKKIVIIDDPVSSLSHIYIFNIGQLIKTLFFNSDKCTQVFVLTHSLYFFYELSDANHTRRKENQKLFRLNKNFEGSQIHPMKYEEIQNDYQSYWYIVKDDKHPPALIANCMRNIVEYFFNFIEKKDLNNVFQKKELQDNKYQAFCRYINRESHSLGQNIFDLKEFDYTIFKEALALVFTESGYKEHYDVMIK